MNMQFNTVACHILSFGLSLVPRPPRPTAERWSGQMLQDSWAGYESYSGMSEYQSDFFYAKLVHTYHVNLISSEDTPTHYSRKLLQFAEFLQLGFPKSDHVSNGITIAHVIAFGKTELQELCKPQYQLLMSRSHMTNRFHFTQESCSILPDHISYE